MYAAGVCSNPTKPCCSDNMKNVDGSGIDCGGSCAPCPQEDKCANVPTDIAFATLADGLCVTSDFTVSSKEECCRACVQDDIVNGCNDSRGNRGKCKAFTFS